VQQMQRHSVAPDRSAALHDHKRAAGDDGQRWQRLGGGGGRGDGDGVDDGSGHLGTSDFIPNSLAISSLRRESFDR